MDDTQRLLHKIVRHMFDNRTEGDMLMDSPKVESWEELRQWANDREKWRVRVRALRAPRLVSISMEPHHVPATEFTFTC